MVSDDRQREVERLRAQIVVWAQQDPDIAAITVVGSWARGTAEMESDIDLVVLTNAKERYVGTSEWVMAAVGEEAPIVRRGEWGPLTERRVRLASGFEVEFGFTRSVRILAVVGALLTSIALAGCRAGPSAASCGDKPFGASTVPHLQSFDIAQDRLVSPEGCGARFSRALVYRPKGAPDDLLAAFASDALAAGWAARGCVTPLERCFERRGYFVAATVPSAIVDPQLATAYPRPLGDGSQILAVVSPA